MVDIVDTILFSVCICTYNRAELLTGVLESVCRQTISTDLYEILVIDNGSTDMTKEITEGFIKLHHNVRYLFEPLIGLAHARNRGWTEGRGIYIGYTDDDCIVPESWLSTADEIVNSLSPDLFGGPYYAAYQTNKPEWFKNEYGSGTHGNKARILDDDEYLSGGNFFVKRDLLEGISGFRTDLGMAGEKLAYAEETQLIKRIRDDLPQKTIFYHPKLYVNHLVNPRKWDLMWVVKQRFHDGRYQFRALAARDHRLGIRHIAGIIILPLIMVIDCLFAVFFRNRKQYPTIQNYLYEYTFNWIRIWGKLVERFRCHFDGRNC